MWGQVIVWGQVVVYVTGGVVGAGGRLEIIGIKSRFMPSSLPVAHTNICIPCMTWCTFTESLFVFVSSHCSEIGPVCGVSLN